MKTIFIIVLSTFVIFMAFSCKKTNPSEPVYQNRVIVGDWQDTTSNGTMNPNDSMCTCNTPLVSVEVERALANGMVRVDIIELTSKDTIYTQIARGNGNYFRLTNINTKPGNYIAYGFALNPDTVWLKPQSFVLYKP